MAQAGEDIKLPMAEARGFTLQRRPLPFVEVLVGFVAEFNPRISVRNPESTADRRQFYHGF